MAIAQMDIRRPGKANERTVTICSMGDIRLIEGGIGRAGRMQAKAFPRGSDSSILHQLRAGRARARLTRN